MQTKKCTGMKQEGALEWWEFAAHAGDGTKRTVDHRPAQVPQRMCTGPGPGTCLEGDEGHCRVLDWEWRDVISGGGRVGWKGKAEAWRPVGKLLAWPSPLLASGSGGK